MTQEDPNNSMQTHPPEEALSGALSIRPSLADPTAAAELFGCAASDFLHAVYGQHAGMESEGESDERIAAIVFGLAALFEDQSGIVELPAGFSTAKAGARLRQQLSRRLNAMSAEDRKLFDDDAQIVTLAVNVFFEELLMMADAWFQTTDREPDEAAFHDFLSQETLHAWMLGWAEKILALKRADCRCCRERIKDGKNAHQPSREKCGWPGKL